MAVDNEKNELINTLKNVELYVEVGVYQGKGIVNIANNHPSISSLVGVDNYQAYTDEWKNYEYFTGAISKAANYSVSYNQSQYNKTLATKLINKSELSDRVVLKEMESTLAAKSFSDKSIDVVFLDAYINHARAYEDVIAWYGKIKDGGAICGQEWSLVDSVIPTVQSAIDAMSIKATICKVNTFWYIQREI